MHPSCAFHALHSQVQIHPQYMKLQTFKGLSFIPLLSWLLPAISKTHTQPSVQHSTNLNRCKWNSSRCIAQNISEPIFNPVHQVNWFPYPFNIQIQFAANKVLRYPAANKLLRNHHHVTSSKSVYAKNHIPKLQASKPWRAISQSYKPKITWKPYYFYTILFTELSKILRFYYEEIIMLTARYRI